VRDNLAARVLSVDFGSSICTPRVLASNVDDEGGVLIFSEGMVHQFSIRAFNTLYPIADAYPYCVRLQGPTEYCLLNVKVRNHCEVVTQASGLQDLRT
jgi:hypothetical protein